MRSPSARGFLKLKGADSGKRDAPQVMADAQFGLDGEVRRGGGGRARQHLIGRSQRALFAIVMVFPERANLARSFGPGAAGQYGAGGQQ